MTIDGIAHGKSELLGSPAPLEANRRVTRGFRLLMEVPWMRRADPRNVERSMIGLRSIELMDGSRRVQIVTGDD